MTTALADEHRHVFATGQQLPEVAEDEAPGPCAFMEVLFPNEDQAAVAARAAGVLVVGALFNLVFGHLRRLYKAHAAHAAIGVRAPTQSTGRVAAVASSWFAW